MAFGLNFNPFKSAHGGEQDGNGDLTERGRKDFFAPFLDFGNSTDAWKDFLKGKITWKDFIDPGSVINNPGQKITDPGEFYTDNKLTEGNFGKRGVASAIVAALAYAGGAAAGGSGSAGEGGIAAEGGGATIGAGTSSGAGTSTSVAAGGNAGPGASSGMGEVSQSPWYSKLFENQSFLDYMGSGGDSLGQGNSMGSGLDQVTYENTNSNKQVNEILKQLLAGKTVQDKKDKNKPYNIGPSDLTVPSNLYTPPNNKTKPISNINPFA